MSSSVGVSESNGFEQRLQQRLYTHQQRQLQRQQQTITARQGAEIVIDGNTLINFCSNDYLGISNHPKVISALHASAAEFGAGSGSSSLVSGRCELHRRLETKLAEKTGREAALLFSCGYMANQAVATSLLERHDAVFIDRFAHSSLIDAARLSAATMYRYHHNDPEALKNRLEQAKEKKKLVLTDSVFSMDGDKARLSELAEVCRLRRALLVVDDAHGFGVLGARAGGLLEEQAISDCQVPLLVATLGKALGVGGAFVAGRTLFIEALRQFARTYIYTTSLSPALTGAALAALDVVENESWRREKLSELIQFFRRTAASQGLPIMPSETAIQPLVIGASEKALKISSSVLANGFFVPAIRPPTVPKGSARLRISLSAVHSRQQIERLLTVLSRSLHKSSRSE